MATTADEDVVQALLVTVAEPERRSFWRRFGAALARAATATGLGTAWLARTGYENRHYLPSVINGAIGDKLARSGDRLAIRMSFRSEAGDVAVEELGADIADGGGHVVVFVHGLMGNDVYWREPFGDAEGFGPMLARTARITPLYVRYNSGLHVSENGRALSELLEQLVTRHGDRINKLSIVGHSMGGLVARSAGHYGTLERRAWVGRMSSVVLLGAPNDGSYLEQLSHLGAFVLEAIPNLSTRIIARVIDERSDGIKDLRLGLLVDEDWQRPDAKQLRRRDRTEVPPLPAVSYHVIAGTLTENTASVVAEYFGDGLVGRASAVGDHVHSVTFPKTGHLALITRPEVQQYVRDALAALAALPPGSNRPT